MLSSLATFFFILSLLIKNTSYSTTPRRSVTGYELFDAVNDYRKKRGLLSFVLHDSLCNNIAERSNVFEKTFSHAGLDEHVKAYIYPFSNTDKASPIRSVVELFATGFSAEEMVHGLSTSPSHDLALRDPSYRYICTYARQKRDNSEQSVGVILLGK